MLASASLSGNAQKRVGDLALVYNSVITNSQDSSRKISSTTSYFLKGNLSRSEVISNHFLQLPFMIPKPVQELFSKK